MFDADPSFMCPIHDRVPVIVQPESYDRGLDRDVSGQDLFDLLCPAPNDFLEASQTLDIEKDPEVNGGIRPCVTCCNSARSSPVLLVLRKLEFQIVFFEEVAFYIILNQDGAVGDVQFVEDAKNIPTYVFRKCRPVK